jgi:hypothetical protein
VALGRNQPRSDGQAPKERRPGRGSRVGGLVRHTASFAAHSHAMCAGGPDTTEGHSTREGMSWPLCQVAMNWKRPRPMPVRGRRSSVQTLGEAERHRYERQNSCQKTDGAPMAGSASPRVQQPARRRPRRRSIPFDRAPGRQLQPREKPGSADQRPRRGAVKRFGTSLLKEFVKGAMHPSKR